VPLRLVGSEMCIRDSATSGTVPAGGGGAKYTGGGTGNSGAGGNGRCIVIEYYS
jgi:hypothetical protein